MEHVGLQYAPELPPALNDISLTLPRGLILGLVGSSGAGKCSIADWLTGPLRPHRRPDLGEQHTTGAAGTGQLATSAWGCKPGHVPVQRHHRRKHHRLHPGATLSQMKAAC